MFELAAAMDRMTVNNEKHIAPGLLHQTSEEPNYHIGLETPLEHQHECELTLVYTRRLHVA